MFVLLSFLAPSVNSASDRSPHELFDALNALRLDPAATYQIASANRIQLRRGEVLLSFEEGKLAFLAPLDGRVTGAVFSGLGHVLALPRDLVEKQQMSRFLGSPVLDQDFISAYVRFTDDTVDELLAEFRHANLTPQQDPAFVSLMDTLPASLNASHSLRILLDGLSLNPKPYFYAGLDGVSTGLFEVLFDSQRREPVLLGQPSKSRASTPYDVWASYTVPSAVPPPPSFHALQYTVDTSILQDNSLDATTSVRLRAETSGERVLTFQLSHSLRAESVSDEQGKPLDYFQNESMGHQERSFRGNDFLNLILAQPLQKGDEFTVRIHYRGGVIENSGNGVLFVGARESWYPHLGDQADFAAYDLTIRWPKHLKLVATGEKRDEREEGEFRVGHWQTVKPVSIAGFNLGEYASTSIAADDHNIEVYANRQLEESLSKRLLEQEPEPVSPFDRIAVNPAGVGHLAMQPPPPSPADALKDLGKGIDSSIRFYEKFSGPFPFHTLSVSQIPGAFGQGWPGLLYVSTYSFLPPEAQFRAGLTSSVQEAFTDVVPYHEVAHQWWGNVVGWSSYRDQWIDEAIANYLALLFADSRKPSEHELRLWLARYRKQLIERSPVRQEPVGNIGALTLGTRLISSKSPDGFNQLIYSKGTWIIHMLREMLRQPGAKDPDAKFVAFLRALSTKYAYRALSSDDLQHEVESVMTPAMDLEGGRSMEWFFEQWVRGTGIPHYRVEFSVRNTENGVVVRGKLFQTGVPHSFIARVPLYANSGTVRNVFLGTVLAEGEETAFQFTAQISPRKVFIDPYMTLLCTSD
jgi:Peptidase family M1 domain